MEQDTNSDATVAIISYYERVVNDLFNLTRAELRRVAYEALLMSDGPGRTNNESDLEVARKTTLAVVRTNPDSEHVAGPWFAIWERKQSPEED